jgi:hypothetical protein
MFIEVKKHRAIRPMLLNVRHIVQVTPVHLGPPGQRSDPPPEPNGTEIILSTTNEKLQVEELYEELRAQILIVVDAAG